LRNSVLVSMRIVKFKGGRPGAPGLGLCGEIISHKSYHCTCWAGYACGLGTKI